MDKYLESLVKKNDVDVEVEAAPRVVEEDISAEEVTEVIEEVTESEPAPEVVEEVIKEEVEKPAKLVKEDKLAKAELKEGTVITVTDLKVFNFPDTASAYKLISGNVIYVKKVGEFSLINYMKYGFGLVSGYTQMP